MSDIKPSVYYAARCMQMVLQEMPGMAEYAYGELWAVIEREIEGTAGTCVGVRDGGLSWRSVGDVFGGWSCPTVERAAVQVQFGDVADGNTSDISVTLAVTADSAWCVHQIGYGEHVYEGTLDEAVRRFVKVLR